MLSAYRRRLFQRCVLFISICTVADRAAAQDMQDRSREKQQSTDKDQPSMDEQQRPDDDALAVLFSPGELFQVNWSVQTGHDDNVLASSGAGDPLSAISGSWRAADAAVKVARRSRHAIFRGDGAANGRYYPNAPSLSAFDGSGDVALSVDLGRRTNFIVLQRALYQPYYEFRFPASAPFDLSAARTDANFLARRESVTFDGRIGIGERIGRNSSLAADYSFRTTRLTGTAEPFRWQLGNAVFARKLTRYAGIRLGYGYGEAHDGLHPNSLPINTHNIDIGLDYARPLSRSRRTKLTFGSGSTVLRQLGAQDVRFLADANVSREIGRTWLTNAGYHRGISFIEGFAGPIYADTFDLRARGEISSRLHVNIFTGYADGQIGLSSSQRNYTTHSAGSELSIPLGRGFSFTTRYDYFKYAFDPAAQVPFGLSPTIHRHGIRFSLSASL
jgi:hypothetical protein